MAENSKIEWCHHTFNPWVGCTKVSPACDNCYAESWAKRSGAPNLWQGDRRRTTPANWAKPLKWDIEAELASRPVRVFCASLADVFDNQVPRKWRDDLWELIGLTPHLTWLLLTKRPQNIAKMLPAGWGDGAPNVWLGTTVENQAEAERRIPHLLAVPTALRFLSCEPLLGPLDLTEVWVNGDPDQSLNALLGIRANPDGTASTIPRIGWAIVGGETGAGARPWDPAWARFLHSACVHAGVPYFFKQMPKRAPIPPDLMVRQFPDVARAA